MTSLELTIGKLAQAADVNIETVRYYQKMKLIKEPPKPRHGYRIYSEEMIARIQFIKRSQQVGFTLKQIRELLKLGDGHCRVAHTLGRKKLDEINQRIKDLNAMRRALTDLLKRCQLTDGKDTHCALIDALNRPDRGGNNL